jgi:hypothetical protein
MSSTQPFSASSKKRPLIDGLTQVARDKREVSFASSPR